MFFIIEDSCVIFLVELARLVCVDLGRFREVIGVADEWRARRELADQWDLVPGIRLAVRYKKLRCICKPALPPTE